MVSSVLISSQPRVLTDLSFDPAKPSIIKFFRVFVCAFPHLVLGYRTDFLLLPLSKWSLHWKIENRS